MGLRPRLSRGTGDFASTSVDPVPSLIDKSKSLTCLQILTSLESIPLFNWLSNRLFNKSVVDGTCPLALAVLRLRLRHTGIDTAVCRALTRRAGIPFTSPITATLCDRWCIVR